MKRLRTAPLLVALALLAMLAACAPAPKTAAPAEEVALRQAMLDWAALGEAPPGIDMPFPDGNLLAQYGTIVIQDDASPASRELYLPRRQVEILNAEAIRKRANAEGDFIYLRYDRVDIEGSEATVRLSLAWALCQATRETGREPLQCGGAEVRFAWRNGAWVASHVIAAWRS